ncbi:MAG: 6,7-dimethyl-8-ribityllumazine synthase [Ignavibacteriae bacterium]|nr:MAG: 6,7-dimethyl-8-ribityllumazine synthase [Ignavibacteriota bacterium]
MGKEKLKETNSKNHSKNIAVVCSKFNEEVTEGLLKGALDELNHLGCTENEVKVFRCPGAFEIPLTAKMICKSKKYDAVICLGAVIKGETAHFEYISNIVSQGIFKLGMKYEIPVTFGVLTAYTDEQAIARSSDDESNKGREAARAAVDMVNQLRMTNL